MYFNRQNVINFSLALVVNILTIKAAFALDYGQVVRIQNDRTGEYLSFDPNNDPNGDKRIVASNNADDNSLWVIKGKLNAPVNAGNPYDRWNCTFGTEVPSNGYEARLEHVATGLDAHFGNFRPEITDRVYPYFFNVGQTKISESSAIHYYNIVLNLHGTNRILISNEYVSFYTNGEAIITQDPAEQNDTWTIIPVSTMTEDQKTLQGQDLVDALGGQNAQDEPAISDQLIENVTALIGLHENETGYSQAINAAFAALVAEPDINERINIVQNLNTNTSNYNSQIVTIFDSITPSTTPELITLINDLLTQNKTRTTELEDEAATAEQELSTAGASSVTDLTNKINQLVAGLDNLWA